MCNVEDECHKANCSSLNTELRKWSWELLLHTENTFTNRTNFFLVAQSMFLAGATLLISNPGNSFYLKVLYIGGIIISFLWLWLQCRVYNRLGSLEEFLKDKKVVSEYIEWKKYVDRQIVPQNFILAVILPTIFFVGWIVLMAYGRGMSGITEKVGTGHVVAKVFLMNPPQSNDWYLSQEFWTATATMVALFVPLFILWFERQPKKSRLISQNTNILEQDEHPEDYIEKVTHVGRLVLKNDGKYIARAVEAYIENIFTDGVERKDFIPVPLYWTHGWLNKSGVIIRDIYPNQTVYLDIFQYIFDPMTVGERYVLLSVAAGAGVDALSKIGIGNSRVKIKLYQENGQTKDIDLGIMWNGRDIPRLSINQN